MKVETSLNNKKEKVGPALREELSRRKLARSSFKEFIRFIKPNYVFKRFHEIIIDEIQKWIDVPGSKLILSMPRQLGKSEICGRLLPAYLFGIDADAPI